jgi:hypothetical protein
VSGRVAISPGGKILERLNAVEQNLRGEHGTLRTEVREAAKTVRTDFFTWFGVVATITFALAGYAYMMGDKASSAADKAAGVADKATSVVEKSESSFKRIEERLDKLEKNMPTNGIRTQARK